MFTVDIQVTLRATHQQTRKSETTCVWTGFASQSVLSYCWWVFSTSVVLTICCSVSEWTMRKGSVSHLQQITFSQLPLSEKNWYKNLGWLPPDLQVVKTSSRRSTYQRKFNPETHLSMTGYVVVMLKTRCSALHICFSVVMLYGLKLGWQT
jgi:hypothetical protein